MHGNSMRGNQEVPVAPAVLRKRRAGRGTHKDTPFAHVAGKSDHCVVPEKAPNKRRKVCGGAGGKAMDQGEPHGGTHGPDADRDTRVPVSPWGAGSRVSAASRQVSEIRAVCVSSACTDLCGGCRVTGIPTATPGVCTFPKPGGRKTLAHGASRVESHVRMRAPERGERLLLAPEVARVVCDAMLVQE
jgi:hypothetical protein